MSRGVRQRRRGPTAPAVAPAPAPEARRRSPATIAALAVLTLGAMLRITLFVGSPAKLNNDGHLDVIEYRVARESPPDPNAMFQAYHPPLYHVLGAAAYRLVAGRHVHDERWAVGQLAQSHGTPAVLEYRRALATDYRALPTQPEIRREVRWHRAAVKTVQGISLVASIGFLVLCWRILALLLPGTPWAVAGGLLAAAVLPSHIYMSAVINNESTVYLLVAAAVLALLKYLHRPAWGWALACGVLAGLTVLTKGTGLAVLPAIGVGLALTVLRAARGPAGQVGLVAGQGLAALTVAALLGLAHYGPMHERFGNPFITNTQLCPPRNMLAQPPGEKDFRLLALHPGELWRRPFIHHSNVNGWATAVFANTWFDYEGNQTLWRTPALRRLIDQERAAMSTPGRNLWDGLLRWPAESVPAALLWQGRVLYLAGLPVCLLALVGLVHLGRRHGEPGVLALNVLVLVSLAVVVRQAIVFPHFCSFKAVYLLAALPATTLWVAAGAATLARGKRPGRAIAVAALAPLALASLWHFAYLLLVYGGQGSAWWAGPP